MKMLLALMIACLMLSAGCGSGVKFPDGMKTERYEDEFISFDYPEGMEFGDIADSRLSIPIYSIDNSGVSLLTIDWEGDYALNGFGALHQFPRQNPL